MRLELVDPRIVTICLHRLDDLMKLELGHLFGVVPELRDLSRFFAERQLPLGFLLVVLNDFFLDRELPDFYLLERPETVALVMSRNSL